MQKWEQMIKSLGFDKVKEDAGHVKEKCFKLIGYPLGHRMHDPNFKPPMIVVTHYLKSVDLHTTSGIGFSNNSGQGSNEVGPSLTIDEYQKHLSLVKTQSTFINFIDNIFPFDLSHVPRIID